MQVRYTHSRASSGVHRKGFLIRVGKRVKITVGRLLADETPWAPEVARIFAKHPYVTDVSVTDKNGDQHHYWRPTKREVTQS